MTIVLRVQKVALLCRAGLSHRIARRQQRTAPSSEFWGGRPYLDFNSINSEWSKRRNDIVATFRLSYLVTLKVNEKQQKRKKANEKKSCHLSNEKIG